MIPQDEDVLRGAVQKHQERIVALEDQVKALAKAFEGLRQEMEWEAEQIIEETLD